MGDNNKSLKDQLVDASITSDGSMGYWEAKLDRIARNTGWAMPDAWQQSALSNGIAGASDGITTAQNFVSSIDGQTAQKAGERAELVRGKSNELVDGANKALGNMRNVVIAANKVITNLRERQNELPGNRLNGVAEAAVRGAQIGATVMVPAVSLTVSILTGWADPVAEINKKLAENREKKAREIYQETVDAFSQVRPGPPLEIMPDPDPIPDDDDDNHDRRIKDVTHTGGTGDSGFGGGPSVNIGDSGSGVGGDPSTVSIGGGDGSGSGVRPLGTPLGNGAYDVNGDGIADYYDYNGDGIPDRWVNGGDSTGTTGGTDSTPGVRVPTPGTPGSGSTDVNYPGIPSTPGYPGQNGTVPGPGTGGYPSVPGTGGYPSVPPAPDYPGAGYPGGTSGNYPGADYTGIGGYQTPGYPDWSRTAVDSGMAGGGVSSLPGSGIGGFGTGAGAGVGLSGTGVGAHAGSGFGTGTSFGAGLGAGATAGGLGTLAAVGGNGSFFTNTPVGATVTNPSGMAGATGLATGLKTGATGAAAGAGATGRGGMMGAPGAAGAGDKDRKRQGLGLMAPKLDDDDDVTIRSAGMMAGRRVKRS